MDTLSRAHRSWNMSRIRADNTSPERAVRSALHQLGFRFRLATGKAIFGKPDIVLVKYRTAIFVHGCFWHRHRNCKFCYTPKSRVEFWRRKFAANVARDRIVKRKLTREGWRVLTIWECEISDVDEIVSRLRAIRSNG